MEKTYMSPQDFFSLKNIRLGIIFLSLSILLSPSLLAQSSSPWKVLKLSTVKTLKKANYTVDVPQFPSLVKAMDGKIIALKGYVLPLELDRPENFIFSLYPYNTCYFCGGAGPETVMEVKAKQAIAYSEKAVKLKGRLRLNAKDPDHLMYILEDAYLVKE